MNFYPDPNRDSSMSEPGLKWYRSLKLWDGKNFSPLEVPVGILAALGNPQDRFQSIHIAGTNGKGSVAYYLEEILIRSKKWAKIGKTISPQIESLNEVACINGSNVSNEELDLSLNTIKIVAEKLGFLPTQYVALLLATFNIFAKENVDVAIIEAGLGGRFDATNVLSNKLLNIITSIGMEHEEQLGNTIESIAWHKAGILQSAVPTILGELSNDLVAIIKESIPEHGCELYDAGSGYVRRGSILSFKGAEISLNSDRFEPEYKLKNKAISAVAALHLGIDRAIIPEGLEHGSAPGRFEHFIDSQNNNFAIIDVAHNPSGIDEIFTESCIDFYRKFKQVDFILTVLKRKNWSLMVEKIENALTNSKIDYNLKLLAHTEDCLKGDELNMRLPEIKVVQVDKLEELKFENKDELKVFLGSSILYPPFIEWAQSRKLLPVSGH